MPNSHEIFQHPTCHNLKFDDKVFILKHLKNHRGIIFLTRYLINFDKNPVEIIKPAVMN